MIPDAKLRVSTILIAAGASLFFCSKSVFVKCAYRYGADYLTVLTLRMALSLPFFLITGALAARRRPLPLSSRQWAAMAGLGFLGYYLSSVLNFAGLTYTSVSLERIVLYSYPSLVVPGATWCFKQTLRRPVLLEAVVSWLGIVVAFAGEAATRIGARDGPGGLGLGMLLVFGSAVTYAAYILLGGEMLRRVGPTVFTSGVVAFSGAFVMLHYLTQRPVFHAAVPTAPGLWLERRAGHRKYYHSQLSPRHGHRPRRSVPFRRHWQQRAGDDSPARVADA